MSIFEANPFFRLVSNLSYISTSEISTLPEKDTPFGRNLSVKALIIRGTLGILITKHPPGTQYDVSFVITNLKFAEIETTVVKNK